MASLDKIATPYKRLGEVRISRIKPEQDRGLASRPYVDVFFKPGTGAWPGLFPV